jgi:hypothetical protein
MVQGRGRLVANADVAWENGFLSSGWCPVLVTVVIICQRSGRGCSWSAPAVVWWSV